MTPPSAAAMLRAVLLGASALSASAILETFASQTAFGGPTLGASDGNGNDYSTVTLGANITCLAISRSSAVMCEPNRNVLRVFSNSNVGGRFLTLGDGTTGPLPADFSNVTRQPLGKIIDLVAINETHMILADAANLRLSMLSFDDTDGQALSTMTTYVSSSAFSAVNLRGMWGITIDPYTLDSYVSDPVGGMIVKVDGTTRAVTVVAGTPGTRGVPTFGGPATSAPLMSPTGISAGSDGLYINDPGAHLIYRVDTSGNLQLVAGTGVDATTGDGGPATSAAVSQPRGASWTSDGSFTFTDTGCHCVRRVYSDGSIVRLGGSGSPGYATGIGDQSQFTNPSAIISIFYFSAYQYIADDGRISAFLQVTNTPSQTASATSTPSSTASTTGTPSETPTATTTGSTTGTGTPSSSQAATQSGTPSSSQTGTASSSATATPSRTGTPTQTASPTASNTIGATPTPTVTSSPAQRAVMASVAFAGGSPDLLINDDGGLAALLRSVLASAAGIDPARLAITTAQAEGLGAGGVFVAYGMELSLNASAPANAGLLVQEDSVVWASPTAGPPGTNASEGRYRMLRRGLQAPPTASPTAPPARCGAVAAASNHNATRTRLGLAVDVRGLVFVGGVDPAQAIAAALDGVLRGNVSALAAFTAAWGACTGAPTDPAAALTVVEIPAVRVGVRPSPSPASLAAPAPQGLPRGAVAAATVIVIFGVLAGACFGAWLCGRRKRGDAAPPPASPTEAVVRVFADALAAVRKQ